MITGRDLDVIGPPPEGRRARAGPRSAETPLGQIAGIYRSLRRPPPEAAPGAIDPARIDPPLIPPGGEMSTPVQPVGTSDSSGAATGFPEKRSCAFCGADPAGDAEPICASCADERAENSYVFAPPGFGLDTCHGTNPAHGCTDPSHADGLPINRWRPR